MLAASTCCSFLTQGMLIVALSLFGLADTVFGLRRRLGGRAAVPPTTLSP